MLDRRLTMTTEEFLNFPNDQKSDSSFWFWFVGHPRSQQWLL